MKTPMAQFGEIEFVYTLVAIEKSVLKVSVSGKVIGSKENAAMTVRSSDVSGTMSLDKKTGETLSSNITMDMKVSVSAQGQSMDMDMIAAITLIGTKK